MSNWKLSNRKKKSSTGGLWRRTSWKYARMRQDPSRFRRYSTVDLKPRRKRSSNLSGLHCCTWSPTSRVTRWSRRSLRSAPGAWRNNCSRCSSGIWLTSASTTKLLRSSSVCLTVSTRTCAQCFPNNCSKVA